MKADCVINTVGIKELYVKMLQCQRQGYRLVQICATATDEGAELIYSVALDYNMENYKVIVPDSDKVNSVSDIFPSAALFENEISELFGVKIESINLDYKGKFYRIEQKTPFKKAKLKDTIEVVKIKEEEVDG